MIHMWLYEICSYSGEFAETLRSFWEAVKAFKSFAITSTSAFASVLTRHVPLYKHNLHRNMKPRYSQLSESRVS